MLASLVEDFFFVTYAPQLAVEVGICRRMIVEMVESRLKGIKLRKGLAAVHFHAAGDMEELIDGCLVQPSCQTVSLPAEHHGLQSMP